MRMIFKIIKWTIKFFKIQIFIKKGAVSDDIRIDWNGSGYLYWSRETRYETGDCTFKIRE